MLVGDANARRMSLPWLAKPDVYARTMGWRSLGEEVEKLARRDRRPHASPPSSATSWRRCSTTSAIPDGRCCHGRPARSPNHHFDLTRRLTTGATEPVLFVSPCGSAERLARAIAAVEPLGRLEARSGPTTSRSYFVYKLWAGASGEIGPLSGC